MTDDVKSSRSLSEIGHLFLSSVRERQTNGAGLPRRLPPGAPRTDLAIDLTAEEVAQVYGPVATSAAAPAEATDAPAARVPPVTAVLASHLTHRQTDAVRDYARHLAAAGQRVGLIELDSDAFRVSCFEQAADALADDTGAADQPPGSADARQIAEAIEELSWDVDRWLLVLPGARVVEARCLLRDVDHWVLLASCDHDGIVSGYRALKGLHDANCPARLSLAVLDARDDDEAERTHRKLASACQEFLSWDLGAEPRVLVAPAVASHTALSLRPQRTAAGAIGPQWQVVADLVARAKNAPAPAPVQRPAPSVTAIEEPMVAPSSIPTTVDAPKAHEPAASRHVADVILPRPMSIATESPAPRATPWEPAPAPTESAADDVIDLPPGQAGTTSILTAVLRAQAGELIECPIPAPACPEARLAVTRDRRLVLLAVADQGLRELRSIGRAYQWLTENRALIAMALPQMAIDAAALPRLRLLVDHADLTADTLQPLLQTGTVAVVAYRKLRWGGKTGLLLQAA